MGNIFVHRHKVNTVSESLFAHASKQFVIRSFNLHLTFHKKVKRADVQGYNKPLHPRTHLLGELLTDEEIRRQWHSKSEIRFQFYGAKTQLTEIKFQFLLKFPNVWRFMSAFS